MAKDKLLLEKIKKQINKAKVVSFDIFDTLLVRPYVQPADLFIHMEKAYECPGFAAERRDAERRIRIRHKELEDVTFDMIYDEIDDEFKNMKQKEMDWEEMVLRANPELKQVYDYALAQDKKVLITSDMYLPTEFLAKVLRKNGFDNWDKLYVSGDVGKRKGTGALFEHLLEDNNVSPKDVLHIGDNKKSDVEIAQSLKIKSFLYEQVIMQFLATNQAIRVFRKQTIGQLDSSILVAVFAYHWQQERCGDIEKCNYWQNLGFQYAGPIAYGYCRFIEKKAKEQGIDNILFVARDGYTLQKIFDTFGNNISNSYVYAPRILKLVSTLECEENRLDKIESIIRFYLNKNSTFAKNYSEAKLSTVEDYYSFLQANKSLLLPLATKYLETFGTQLLKEIGCAQRVAMVDTIGVSFSAQTLIEKSCNKKILGIYWHVVTNKFSKMFNHDCFSYTAYSRESIVKENTINLLTKHWPFIEFLLSSPECPIVDVTDDVEPIFDKNPTTYEKFRADIYPFISQQAELFAKELETLFFRKQVSFDFKVLIQLINCFIENPDKLDICNMSKIAYNTMSGFSNDMPLFSTDISPIEILLHPIKTRKKLLNLKWKTGFQKFFLYGIYHKFKSPFKKYVKILGLTWSSTKIVNGTRTRTRWFGIKKSVSQTNKKKKYLFGVPIFSVKRKSFYDIKRILGIIVSQKFDVQSFIRAQNKTILRQIERVNYLVKAQSLHAKTFSAYQNKFYSQDVFLIATGPTVNSFNIQRDQAIMVGVNGAIYLKNISLDYLFMQDRPINREHTTSINEDANVYSGNDCKKFYGILPDIRLKELNSKIGRLLPSNKIVSNVSMYYLDPILGASFAWDPAQDLITDWGGTVFSALQFIFYTNPKRIFLVGCDCSGGNAVRTTEAWENYTKQKNGWNRVKNFAEMYYPNTEIISVNPVGLKGLFRDVYTKEYLHKHPEIDSNELEFLEEVL